MMIPCQLNNATRSNLRSKTNRRLTKIQLPKLRTEVGCWYTAIVIRLFVKPSCNTRFQRAFTTCCCVFRVITLVAKMLKTRVAMSLYSMFRLEQENCVHSMGENQNTF